MSKAYLSEKEICIFKQLTTQGPRATKGGEHSSMPYSTNVYPKGWK